MAQFTMFFKDYIDGAGGTIVTDDRGTHLENAHLVGLGAYPLFSGQYRQRLNGMIVDRYMNREIGVETASDFRRLLSSRMNEIMPLYNRMYEADRLVFDPLRTFDMRTVSEGSAEGVSTAHSLSDAREQGSTSIDANATTSADSTTETGNRSRAVTSDTPQVRLSGDEDYASASADQTGQNTGTGSSSEESATESNTDSETTSTSEADTSSDSSTIERGESHSYGYQGSPSALVVAFRDSLVNTDMLVLNELDMCFMQVYGNDDVPVFGYDRFNRTYPRF